MRVRKKLMNVGSFANFHSGFRPRYPESPMNQKPESFMSPLG
jgi:hypothetical protein